MDFDDIASAYSVSRLHADRNLETAEKAAMALAAGRSFLETGRRQRAASIGTFLPTAEIGPTLCVHRRATDAPPPPCPADRGMGSVAQAPAVWRAAKSDVVAAPKELATTFQPPVAAGNRYEGSQPSARRTVSVDVDALGSATL